MQSSDVYPVPFTLTVDKTVVHNVMRQSASVMQVGLVWHVSKHVKKSWLELQINGCRLLSIYNVILSSYISKKQKNKADLNFKKYYMRCSKYS